MDALVDELGDVRLANAFAVDLSCTRAAASGSRTGPGSPGTRPTTPRSTCPGPRVRRMVRRAGQHDQLGLVADFVQVGDHLLAKGLSRVSVLTTTRVPTPTNCLAFATSGALHAGADRAGWPCTGSTAQPGSFCAAGPGQLGNRPATGQLHGRLAVERCTPAGPGGRRMWPLRVEREVPASGGQSRHVLRLVSASCATVVQAVGRDRVPGGEHHVGLASTAVTSSDTWRPYFSTIGIALGVGFQTLKFGLLHQIRFLVRVITTAQARARRHVVAGQLGARRSGNHERERQRQLVEELGVGRRQMVSV